MLKPKKLSFKKTLYPMILLPVLLAACGGNTGASKAEEPATQSRLLLGTVCRITLYAGVSDEAFQAAFQRIADIEKAMSVNLPDSEVSIINEAAGTGEWTQVSQDTFTVVEKALEIAGMSSGGFDPSVGPLVKLWGVGTENARIPRPEEIETALALTDYRRVQTDPENRGVLLADRGMALDLGGIAKGYAADEAAKILVNHGVTGATVNLGGNVLTLGEKPDGSPWKIGIQDPASGRGDYVAILQVKDLSVVTSGPYERFFIGPDGKRYHHILSGETGYPVESDIISVTLLARDSMTADALSTAVFVLGLEKGMELIESLEGIEGMFITQEQAVYASSGLLNQEIPFSLSDTNYTLVR